MGACIRVGEEAPVNPIPPAELIAGMGADWAVREHVAATWPSDARIGTGDRCRSPARPANWPQQPPVLLVNQTWLHHAVNPPLAQRAGTEARRG